VELLVVIGIIALLISILLPSLNRARETANRVKCAANLKAIGNALLLYSNDNKSLYPRTTYLSGNYPLIPTWGSGAICTNPFSGTSGSAFGTAGRPSDNDVSAAIYLLLTTQDITGDSFVCPSSSAEKWDFGGGANSASNWSNWNGQDEIRKRLSYSYQNPYGDNQAVTAGFRLGSGVGADYAVMADINPGSPQGSPLTLGAGHPSSNVLQVTKQSNGGSSGPQMSMANSDNHDKVGQQVLYGDGHVEWSSDPFAGPSQDNIYARRSTQTQSNNGASDLLNGYTSPVDARDNVLLPTN